MVKCFLIQVVCDGIFLNTPGIRLNYLESYQMEWLESYHLENCLNYWETVGIIWNSIKIMKKCRRIIWNFREIAGNFGIIGKFLEFA